MLIIFDTDLPFKKNLSKQTDSGKDQSGSFRGLWNLHLAAQSITYGSQFDYVISYYYFLLCPEWTQQK